VALDVAPIAPRKPPIFALANLIQSLAQMPHDMELVEQNRGLRRMRRRRQPKRLPHVHYRQPEGQELTGGIGMGVKSGCKLRKDVLQGELTDAIFAASFGQLVRNQGSAVYRDPAHLQISSSCSRPL
jgi:hypothetical protein